MHPDLARVLDKIRRADLPPFSEITLDHANARTLTFGETPLHVIAVWGDVDDARILLDHGAEIDPPGEHGYTPLHEAIGQGHAALAAFLIARGASLTIKNEWGETAFDIIARSESPAIHQLIPNPPSSQES